MNNIKKIVEDFTIIFLLFICTDYMAFCQIKIDTVYIKYFDSAINTTKDSAYYYRVRTISNGILKAEDYSLEDGVIICSGYYKKFYPYIKQGSFVFYTSVIDGGIVIGRIEGDYLNDKKDSIWKYYYPSGELCFTQTYVKGIKTGLLQGYYKTGEIRRIEEYKDGDLIQRNCYTKSNKDTICNEMFIRSSFPGGEKAMVEYLQNHIIYPKQAREIQGIVFIKFYVNTKGSIENVKVIKGKGVHLFLTALIVGLVL